MEKRIFVIVCVFLSISGLAGAVIFHDCESPRTYIPGVVNHQFTCYYSDNMVRSPNISWTIVKDDGTTLNLVTCNRYCTSATSYRRAILFDNRFLTYAPISRLVFNDTDSEFDGNLTCTHTFANGTVERASCRQKAVRIKASPQEVNFNEQGVVRSAYCYKPRQSGSTVKWALVTYAGHTVDLGTCRSSGACPSLHPNVTFLQSTSYTYTKAEFRHWQRDMGGQLFCSYTKDGVEETVNMTLTVYSPATIDNCNVEIIQRNWTAIFSCEVTRVFLSSGDYKYRLWVTTVVLEDGVRSTSYDYIFKNRKSYRDALTVYTNRTDNKRYYSGRLVISWPLSDEPIISRDFRLELGSRLSTFQYKTIEGFGVFSTPSRLTHNCSYLNHIPGSKAEPCFCSADSLGSPPGRLLWLLGDTVTATGDYNVSHLQLPSDKMGDQCDGLTVTCQLDWVNAASLIVAKHGTCPPSKLTHNCTDLDHIAGSRAAPCFCSADSLGSPPGRLFWLLGDTVLATGDYNVSHLQVPADKMGDQCDGLTLTCQLDWVYTIILTVTKHEACNSEENKQPYKWATIVLGGLLLVVGIASVVVVVILCRRGHPHSGLNTGPVKSQPQPQKNGTELATFTCQNIYETLQRNESGPPQSQTNSEELPSFTGQNIYEGLMIPKDPKQNPGGKKHPLKKNAPKGEVEGHI